MEVWKMIFLFHWVIIRFHVDFRGCIPKYFCPLPTSNRNGFLCNLSYPPRWAYWRSLYPLYSITPDAEPYSQCVIRNESTKCLCTNIWWVHYVVSAITSFFRDSITGRRRASRNDSAKEMSRTSLDHQWTIQGPRSLAVSALGEFNFMNIWITKHSLECYQTESCV